ncbi:Bestrophin, RFP-TM, chloride channel-domain-containing protein [Coprinopsis sp. MPI-PUGE-AT-0042]|nr:Bestrophin, RFP-TM, chloride channel-domain-containing protein [Coprinopsis sp. MPI-PUGE-AT-0042]
MASPAGRDVPPLLSPLARSDTFSHKGFSAPDPFAPRRRPGASFIHALLATAVFRCWHHLLFAGAWSTLITILNKQGHKLVIETTLLTVLGTVLGFVISYRTTASFERYNEGRRFWSQIILATRGFARVVWFQIPDQVGATPEETEELKARALVEKKTVINLLEAFAVAVKHYLRGEDGIYYQDLYYLVKFLPAYALPPGIPSQHDLTSPVSPEASSGDQEQEKDDTRDIHLSVPTSPNFPAHDGSVNGLHQRHHPTLPLPISSPSRSSTHGIKSAAIKSPRSAVSFAIQESERVVIPQADEAYLFPSKMPSQYSIFDLFPFSLLIGFFTSNGRAVKGKKAQRVRAKLRSKTISQNLPLEISLYLGSYLFELQLRKYLDVPTMTSMHNNLNLLSDSLAGLERILTTPVPFSYSVHLWVVTFIYCLSLPFQVFKPLGWVTIPATIISSFIFFGFLVAGEEIENPFGYDKNDLNLDHFTSNIIHNELKAITAAPPPHVRKWIFHPENNLLFSGFDERTPPDVWVSKGHNAIAAALSRP